MNKQRKAMIKTEIDTLRAFRKAMRAEPTAPEAIAKALEESKARIVAIHDEEQDAFEKMSEKQQAKKMAERNGL